MNHARRRSHERGYSLVEALVVIAMIGLITGITIPAFMTYLRANRIRSSATYFQTAIRYARQRAVTKRIQTRLSFDTTARPGTYSIYEATYNASGTLTGWTQMQPAVRSLDQGVYFTNDAGEPVGDGYSGLSASGTDGKPDIVFNVDGSAVNSANAANPPGTIWMKTDFTKVMFNRYKFRLLSVGTMETAASHG